MAPLPGVLTAGQPAEGDLAVLGQAGDRTVVDLRPPLPYFVRAPRDRSW
jgi:hypothetical protein